MVRPPARGAKLRSLDDSAARAMPGVVAVVREGDVVGVVAEREEQARAAAAAVIAEWHVVPVEGPTADVPMRSDAGVDEKLRGAAVRLTQTYVLPPIASAPIGPSAAVADVRGYGATMYVGTHRPFGVREQIAKTLGFLRKRSACCPRSRAERTDATARPTRPSRLRSSPRARVVRSSCNGRAKRNSRGHRLARRRCSRSRRASALMARIVAWRYEEHTNVHTAAGLDPQVLGVTSGRNAIPPYAEFPAKVTLHIEPTRLRTANFRSLAAAENVFAIASFMDELAVLAGQDPVAFRLRHIKDERFRRVVEGVAERSAWSERPGGRRRSRHRVHRLPRTYVAAGRGGGGLTRGAVRW